MHRRVNVSVGVVARLALVVLVAFVALVYLPPIAVRLIAGPERICSGDEVMVVEDLQGGAYCETRKAGDKTCPDGERLRRLLDPPREDCITDEVGHESDGLPKGF
ncbi:MAG: hypothetical protein WAK18_09870 [Nocardioidaceae bacterium]